MDDQKKMNEANGTDNNGAGQEPENVISTKEAFKAIGHNAKVAGKQAWTKAKPVLKRAAIVTAVIVGAKYAIDKTCDPALEKRDDWVDDDIIDGVPANVSDVGTEPAAETATETPADAE